MVTQQLVHDCGKTWREAPRRETEIRFSADAIYGPAGAVAPQGGRCHVRSVSTQAAKPAARPRRVALFVTCLVDLFRPSIGFAAVKLLQDAGCTVEVPPAQVCCGQPAYNSGDRTTARDIARQVIDAFQGYDAIVAPSGSCGGMLAHHYPGLFEDDPAMKARAEAFAGPCHELVS
jgi:L-lactate dehydrogenase complex protein LldE